LKRGKKMIDKIKKKNGNSELSDWMLAIDFDPAKYKCSKKKANVVADILSL
jgi:hypothetical protein